MKILMLFAAGLAVLAALFALAATASAVCSSCMQEGDWSESAQNFIEGKPINEEPIEFGPKAVRKTESQFEKDNEASAAAAPEMVLKSINATPATAVEASPVKITAVFGLSNQTEEGSATELQLTATATIKDSTGKEVEKLSLIKSGMNEYSKDWTAGAPGVYSVDIAAASLQGTASFANSLQIVVTAAAAANATESAAGA